MTCRGNCQFHEGKQGTRAKYNGGYWCKVCVACFKEQYGPRCPCCHQCMRHDKRDKQRYQPDRVIVATKPSLATQANPQQQLAQFY